MNSVEMMNATVMLASWAKRINQPTLQPMPKWDGLKLLPDHVIAPLLRALACIPRTADTRPLLPSATRRCARFWPSLPACPPTPSRLRSTSAVCQRRAAGRGIR